MKVKITMEMSGNQFLDMLRKVPKPIANDLLANSVAVTLGLPSESTPSSADLLWFSAKSLIESKKR